MLPIPDAGFPEFAPGHLKTAKGPFIDGSEFLAAQVGQRPNVVAVGTCEDDSAKGLVGHALTDILQRGDAGYAMASLELDVVTGVGEDEIQLIAFECRRQRVQIEGLQTKITSAEFGRQVVNRRRPLLNRVLDAPMCKHPDGNRIAVSLCGLSLEPDDEPEQVQSGPGHELQNGAQPLHPDSMRRLR